MKRFLILLCLVAFTTSGSVLAQNNENGVKGGKKYREQVEALRVGIFTQLMELSAEDGQKFWPLHKQYMVEMHQMHRRERNLYKKVKNGDATQQDVQEWVDIEKQKGELIEKWADEFLKVLTPNQVAKMFVAEEELMKQVMRTAYNKR